MLKCPHNWHCHFLVRTTMSEATAFGAAMAAGIACGAWQLDKMTPPASDRTFDPAMPAEGQHRNLCSLFIHLTLISQNVMRH